MSYLYIAIFLLFWIGPVIAGIAVAKKKNRTAKWFILGILPGWGFWIFIIHLFLKPLKICEKCGKTIPKDSVVCPYCTAETGSSVLTDEEKKNKKKAEKRKTIAGICTAVAVIVVFAVVLLTAITRSFKSSEPYKHSLELMENNLEVQMYLGNDYKTVGIIQGSMSTSSSGSGSAVITYKIKSSNGISRVHVIAQKENGVWNYQVIRFYKELNKKDYIDLLLEKNL